jgi:Flp pilus assembly pilin Flp
MSRIHVFASDVSGATAIEYVLIGALASILAIAGMTAAGASITSMINMVSDTVSAAIA